jgi:hypothetical protein
METWKPIIADVVGREKASVKSKITARLARLDNNKITHEKERGTGGGRHTSL